MSKDHQFISRGSAGYTSQRYNTGFQKETLRRQFGGQTPYSLNKKIDTELKKTQKTWQKITQKENLGQNEKNELKKIEVKKTQLEEAKKIVAKIGKTDLSHQQFNQALGTLSGIKVLSRPGTTLSQGEIEKKIDRITQEKIKEQELLKEEQKIKNIRITREPEISKEVEETKKRIEKMKETKANSSSDKTEISQSDSNQNNQSFSSPSLSTLPLEKKVQKERISILEAANQPKNNTRANTTTTQKLTKNKISSTKVAEDMLID